MTRSPRTNTRTIRLPVCGSESLIEHLPGVVEHFLLSQVVEDRTESRSAKDGPAVQHVIAVEEQVALVAADAPGSPVIPAGLPAGQVAEPGIGLDM